MVFHQDGNLDGNQQIEKGAFIWEDTTNLRTNTSQNEGEQQEKNSSVNEGLSEMSFPEMTCTGKVTGQCNRI